MTEVEILKEQIICLQDRIQQLERKVEFLRTHPTIAQGMKGERFICRLTQGIATQLNASFDVETQAGIKLEVKFSKLHSPAKSAADTRRWTWSKPLGWLDKGKDYDFLVLVSNFWQPNSSAVCSVRISINPLIGRGA